MRYNLDPNGEQTVSDDVLAESDSYGFQPFLD
jgi:hypothetical protein